MPSYDTIEGIQTYLTSLEGLNRLITDRHKAGYERKEHLHPFVILGRWHTDTCGNFGKCAFELDYKPTDIASRLPSVVRPDDILIVQGLSLRSGVNPEVPRPNLVCPECDKGWTLETAHDTAVRQDDRTVPLRPGVSIADLEKEWDGDKEGIFRFGPEPSVRNPKFIDLNPHPEYKDQVINEKGWRYRHPPFNHERVTKSYIAEPGDEASLTVFIYEHVRCAEIRQARWSREFFEEVLREAGFKGYTLNEIPNEYCRCTVCGPWFLMKIPAGDIKIGWRKRVIKIDWSDTDKDLLKLFEKENVTKEPHMIHAWGKDAAIDYLGRIRGALA